MNGSAFWTSFLVAVSVVGGANAETATETEPATSEGAAPSATEPAPPTPPAPHEGSATTTAPVPAPAKPVEANAPVKAPEKTEAPSTAKPATTTNTSVRVTKTSTATPAPAPAPQHYALPAPADAPPRPAPKGPIHSRVTLAITTDSVRHGEAGFDLFSSNDVQNGIGAFIGYTVIDGTISVVPEFGFSSGSVSRSGLFGGALGNSTLDTRTIYGDLCFRLAALSFLEPEARVAAGASTLKVSVDSTGAAPTLQTTETAPFLSFGGGITLRTPAGALETRSGSLRTVAFALTVEGGYVTGKSLDIAPTPSQDAGRVPTRDAHLGTLERSGPYARLVAALRF